MNDPKKRIVVVGGGAGGLELVARLGRKYSRQKQIEITLIDSSPIHFWKPLLHEVAAGTLNSFDDGIAYLAYASTHHFQFCLGTMSGLNRATKEVILGPIQDEGREIIPERRIAYDILIIAVGSIANNFGVQGMREYCQAIDTSDQALDFQQHLIKTLMALPYSPKQDLHIAIVGGGATGVELAAELHYAINQMPIYGFEVDAKKISFSLIEGAERLLPALPVDISISVQDQLKELGVTLYTSEQVSEVTKDGFQTKSGKFIPADIKIWVAGIKAPDFLAHLDGLSVNRINQLIVKPSLQTTLDDAIFALGDCAQCMAAGTETPVPPRAQAAHQQASFLMKIIPDVLAGKTDLPAFEYHDYGSLISLSHYETVGNLRSKITKSRNVRGLIARLAYLSLYRAHQAALYGYWRVGMIMFANMITNRIRPRLKLH